MAGQRERLGADRQTREYFLRMQTGIRRLERRVSRSISSPSTDVKDPTTSPSTDSITPIKPDQTKDS